MKHHKKYKITRTHVSYLAGFLRLTDVSRIVCSQLSNLCNFHDLFSRESHIVSQNRLHYSEKCSGSILSVDSGIVTSKTPSYPLSKSKIYEILLKPWTAYNFMLFPPFSQKYPIFWWKFGDQSSEPADVTKAFFVEFY